MAVARQAEKDAGVRAEGGKGIEKTEKEKKKKKKKEEEEEMVVVENVEALEGDLVEVAGPSLQLRSDLQTLL